MVLISGVFYKVLTDVVVIDLPYQGFKTKNMIYPYQKSIPFEFDNKSNADTITIENAQALGPLHLYLCRGLDFTSQNQCPIVRPYLGIVPEIMQSVHRLIRKSDSYLEQCCGSFFTLDSNFERFWTYPYKYLEFLQKLQCVLSPDFSLYCNMLQIQKFWNSFRNKLLSAFYQHHDIPLIPAPSWGDLKYIELYMEGWPKNSIIAINSTGVGRDKRSRHIWLDGYYAMLDILKPIFILRYGCMIEGEKTEISRFYQNNNKQN